MSLSAIVLTCNEALNIAECVDNLSFANEILVVDSESSDGTPEIAKAHGARVVTHPFSDFAAQRNFAMSQAIGDWCFFIDADERVTPKLAEEIRTVSKGSVGLSPPAERPALCVYSIPFQTFFFGKRLRFGDARLEFHIRLFPKRHVQWDQPVHEKIVTDLPCRKLKNSIWHYTTRDFAHYMAKVERYVPRELAVMKQKGIKPSLLRAVVVPPAKFFQLYFCKLGIFDGIAGFQYAILSAYYAFEKYFFHQNYFL